jgi:DNA modification methylase
VAYADAGAGAFRHAFLAAGFKLASCLIWVKNQTVLGRSDYQWMHEPVLYGWKPGAPHAWYGGRDKRSVFESPGSILQPVDGGFLLPQGGELLKISGDNLKLQSIDGTVIHCPKPMASPDHPTTKPVALIERMLANSSRLDDVVLDPFGGSGSTLIACHNLRRSARLIELSPRFAQVIIERWQQYSGLKAELAEDGHAG